MGCTYWRMLSDAINETDAPWLFIGMFDEYDEATNLIPVSDDPPVPDTDPSGNPLTFQTSDPMPNDWWLALTGAAKQALQGNVAISDAIPTEAELENRSNVGGEVRWQVLENGGLAIVETADSQIETTQFTVDGKTFFASYSLDPYLYFQVDDHFLSQEADGRDVTIEVEYLDSTTGTFRIGYDGVSDYFESSGSAQLTGSYQWRTHRFEISDAQFANVQNEASDFRIEKVGGNLFVRRVRVVKESVLSVSSNLGATNTDSGLQQVIPADGQTLPTTIGNRDARILTGTVSSRYMYFRSDDGFANEINAGLNAIVEIVYFDSGNGTLNIQYDSTGMAYQTASLVSLQNTGEWRTARFYLDDAYFGSRQNGSADFRILGDNIPIDQVRYCRPFGDLIAPVIQSTAASVAPSQQSFTVTWTFTDDWATGLMDQWSTHDASRVRIEFSNDGGTMWSFVDEVYEGASATSISSYDTSSGKAVWSDQYEWDTANLAPGSYLVRMTPIDGRGNIGDPVGDLELVLSESVALVGDYNLDGAVDVADYAVWRDNFRASVAAYSGPDGDGDGQITQLDYNVWKSNFGATPAPPSAISSASILYTVETSEPIDAASNAVSTELINARNAGIAMLHFKTQTTPELNHYKFETATPSPPSNDNELLLLQACEVARNCHEILSSDAIAYEEVFSEDSLLADLLVDAEQSLASESN